MHWNIILYCLFIWKRCHGRKCVRGRNAAARTLLSHPPHPTPPPSESGDDATLTVAAIVTRMLVSESCGWWLGNGLFWVANSSCFGCGIAFSWLRNRLFLVAESVIFGCGIGSFLVAEAPFFGCGSVSDFGCGIVEIWLRKRRNMVSESDFVRIEMVCFAEHRQAASPFTRWRAKCRLPLRVNKPGHRFVWSVACTGHV